MARKEVPERIGPYEVREKIGEGGMATVYRAWHGGLHRFEALKIPREGFDEGEHLQRLLLEARTSARLHHPHIVAIHAVSEEGADPPFLAMDLVEGTTLEALLHKRGRLDSSEALGILEQVASALDYAHAQKVIHRDIKPGNILLQERAGQIPSGKWNVKVVDFGISRAGEDDGGTRLTKSGMLVGTPEYMSPEQAGSGVAVDFRTDLYSLGVLAYEMLCGQPPFIAGDGVSRMSILVAHVTRTPPILREANPEISPATSAAIERVLSKNPDDRFSSGMAFVQAARASTSFDAPTAQLQSPTAFDPAPASSAPPSTSAARDVPRKRRMGALVAGAVGLGALTITALSLTTRRDAEPVPASTSIPSATSTVASTAAPATTSSTSSTLGAPATVRRREVVQRAVPFAQVNRRTASLPGDQVRVVREGREGVREVTLEIATRAGRQLSRRVLATRVVTPPLSRIVETGARPDATPVATSRPTPRATSSASSGAGSSSAPRRVRRSRRVSEEASVTSRPRRARRIRASRPRAARRVRRATPTRRVQRAAPARRARVREAPLPP